MSAREATNPRFRFECWQERSVLARTDCQSVNRAHHQRLIRSVQQKKAQRGGMKVSVLSLHSCGPTCVLCRVLEPMTMYGYRHKCVAGNCMANENLRIQFQTVFFSFLGEPPGWIYNYLISMCVPDETPASRAIAQRHISLLASIWPNLSGGSVCSCHTSVPRIKPCARWDVCVCVSKSDKLCPPKSSSNRARMIDCVVHAELLRARARPRTLSHCVPNNLSMTKGWHRYR